MNQNNLKELLDCNPHIMCRISYNPLAMIYLNKLQSVSPFSWAADQFCAHANLIIIIEQSFPQLSWSKTVIACLQQENFCCRWQTHIKPCCWSMRTCLQCNQLANQADQAPPMCCVLILHGTGERSFLMLPSPCPWLTIRAETAVDGINKGFWDFFPAWKG